MYLCKVKVKFSLRLTKHQVMKTYEEVEVELHAFLTAELDGSEWTGSRPAVDKEKVLWNWNFFGWLGGYLVALLFPDEDFYKNILMDYLNRKWTQPIGIT